MKSEDAGGRSGRSGEEDPLSAYNEPPEVPREEMWVAIREALTEERAEGVGGSPSLVVRWGLAAAALLVLGVAIGRWSAAPTADGPVADATRSAPAEVGEAGGATAVQRVAYEHLTAAESFLAGVRADARRGEVDPSLGSWARRLLTRTRLLQDSPVSRDPELATLLEDLELILVQVSRAAHAQDANGERAREELQLLTRGMERSDLNLRIEAALPASIEMIGT